MGNRIKYYHSSEVAEKCGCSIDNVYLALKDGRLKGYKQGRKWLINMNQAAAFESLSNFVVANKHSENVNENQKCYWKYIEDDEHSEELLSRILAVQKSLCISTANLKNLYLPVKGEEEKVPFLRFLEMVVENGVTVNLLYSSLSSVLYQESEKYPNLFKSPLFHSNLCLAVHMKMFIFDEKEVYIGSANITNAAIGKRAKKVNNFEAGLITNDRDIVDRAKKHFMKAWENDCADCPIMEKCCDAEQF